jgi:hypothetical protein
MSCSPRQGWHGRATGRLPLVQLSGHGWTRNRARLARSGHHPRDHLRRTERSLKRITVSSSPRRSGSKERLWEKLVHGIFLGGEQWIKKMLKVIDSKPRSSDHPRTQRGVGRPKMAAVTVSPVFFLSIPLAVAKGEAASGSIIVARTFV